MPIPTWRWSVRLLDPYGWSPTDEALPDIRTVNAMNKTLMMHAERIANPPIFAPGNIFDLSLEPGAVNIYTTRGQDVYTPNIHGNYPIALEQVNDIRERIRQVYKTQHFLMQMNAEKEMTAREVLERKRERVTVAGSTIGRFTAEVLDPIIKRFMQIEYDANRLPPPPAGFEGIQFAPMEIDYQGPLAQEQRELETIQGAMETLQSFGPFFQIWPETTLFPNPEVMMAEIAKTRGLDEDATKSLKEYRAAVEEAKRQQQAAEQAAQQKDAAAALNQTVGAMRQS
jgi:hypothetical protein